MLVSLDISTAYSHARREVGPYRFVVGFLVEPAFEGLKNGVDLRVLQADTEAPGEGLQDTLQVEVTHVPSTVQKVLKLRTIYRDPGHYTADLIPTAPGQYRFRFFGSIQELAVQEIFDSKSGGGQFDDVESSVDPQFPVRLPEIRELANALLSLAGQWQLQLVIRRQDAFDARAVLRFAVTTREAGGSVTRP